MQKQWDDIDKLIFDSKEDIESSYDYNEKLMSKIAGENNNNNNNLSKRKINYENKVLASSLIMAGLLMMIIFSTDLQYRIIELQCKIKSEVLLIQYKDKYNSDILKKITRGDKFE